MPARGPAWKKAWRKVARAVGASLEVSADSIELRTHAGAIVADGTIFRNPKGNVIRNATTVVAAAPGAGPLHLRLARGRRGFLGRVLRLQDIEVGEARFDRAFLIKANDPVLARVWLDEGVRRHLTRAIDFAFTLRAERVEARAPYIHFEPEPVIAAIRAVGLLARRGRELGRAFDRLGRALGARVETGAIWAPDGDGRLVVPRREPLVVDAFFGVAGARGDEHVYTRVSCRRSASDRFVLVSRVEEVVFARGLRRVRTDLGALDARGDAPEVLRQRLDAATLRFLGRAAPAVVRALPSPLEVLMPGFVDDRNRVEAALELATRLAGDEPPEGVGPYR